MYQLPGCHGYKINKQMTLAPRQPPPGDDVLSCECSRRRLGPGAKATRAASAPHQVELSSTAMNRKPKKGESAEPNEGTHFSKTSESNQKEVIPQATCSGEIHKVDSDTLSKRDADDIDVQLVKPGQPKIPTPRYKSMEITKKLEKHLEHNNISGVKHLKSDLAVGFAGRVISSNYLPVPKQGYKRSAKTALVGIEIILDNSGAFSYQHELFGNKIIISKRFTHDSSVYAIQGSRGPVYFTKWNDLEKFIDYFNLQLSNIMSIVNQDPNFWLNSNPVGRYYFNTGPSNPRMFCNMTYETVEPQYGPQLFLKKKDTDGKKAQTEEIVFEVIGNKRRAIQRDTSPEVKNNTPDPEEKTDNLAMIEEKILENQKYPIKEVLNDKPEIEQQKPAMGKKRSALLNYKAELHKENLCLIRASIKKSLNKEFNKTQKMKYIKKCIVSSKMRYKEINATIDILEHRLADMHLLDGKYMDDLGQNNAHMLECNMMEKKVKDQIYFKGVKKEELAIYGSEMLVLVEKIDEATKEKQFRKPPIGPMGAYIMVMEEEWGPAIESFFGSFLKAFCVANYEDMTVLHNIIDTEFTPENQPLITDSYAEEKYNVEEFAVHPGMLDVLTITHPVVFNCLVDNFEIENILLVPTHREAYKMMMDQKLVPKNCRLAITQRADQVYPDPDFRSYCGPEDITQRYLKLDLATRPSVVAKWREVKLVLAQKKNLEMEAHTLHLAKLKNNSHMSTMQRKVHNLKIDVVNLDEKIASLKSKLKLLKLN